MTGGGDYQPAVPRAPPPSHHHSVHKSDEAWGAVERHQGLETDRILLGKGCLGMLGSWYVSWGVDTCPLGKLPSL